MSQGYLAATKKLVHIKATCSMDGRVAEKCPLVGTDTL